MKPIIALTGPGEITKKEELNNILKDINKKDISIYYADETEFGFIFSECLQNSLFSTRNVIVVKNIDALKDSEKKKMEDALVNYMDSINPNTILILVSEEFSQRVAKKIQETGELIECKKMYKNDLLRHINIQFKEKGIKYEQELPDFILYLSNDDEWESENMLQSLLAFAEKGKVISIEEAKALLFRSGNLTIFDLIDGIFEKNMKKAILALSDLKKGDEPVTHIIYMIMRSAKLLWSYLSLKEKNDTADQMRIKPYELKRIREYARTSDLKFLSRIFEFLSSLEIKAKSMQSDFSYLEIENLTYTLN